MGLEGVAQLLVAGFELQAVRSIRDAVRANLLAAGGVEGPLGTITNRVPTAASAEPTPRIEPRLVHRPDPRFEPREVIQPQPDRVIPDQFAPIEPERPTRLISPLLPPWKQLPPPAPTPEYIQVKFDPPKADANTGTMLDLFI